jgi:hypothetical protein
MTRDKKNNYTTTVSNQELGLILDALEEFAHGPFGERPAVVSLRDRLAQEYNALYQEGDE